jgi:hypothetical protein
MEFVVISLLNGITYGLLLFMLSSGLTLIFSMMGILNFRPRQLLHAGRLFRLPGQHRGRLLARPAGRAAAGRRWSARWSSVTACAAPTASATSPNCCSPSAWPSSSRKWCT